MKIILASASPRRKEILSDLGLDFTVIPAPDDAEPEIHEMIDAIVAAQAKARTVARTLNEADKRNEPVILGADTIVCYKKEVLGKPKDKDDAIRMLKMLSGKKHTVATGICTVLAMGDDPTKYPDWSAIEKTEVVFRTLSDDEIIRYVETGEPMDKAGSYAIQGIGKVLVESVHGCYSNVVGLPVNLVLDQISQIK